jgi:integrase
MIEDMKVRNFSPVTQRCYVHAVAKFAQYFKQSPDRLELAEVRAYPIHLVETGASWAAFNVAVSALRFFYGVTLGRPAMVERIPYARKQQQLPVILSAKEVVRFFAAVPRLKLRTALMIAGACPRAGRRPDPWAAGLRVSEVIGLRVTDIDSDRILIRVEQGKGQRDRYVMLSAAARRAARLLAGGPAKTLAVSRPGRGTAARRGHAPCGVPACLQNGKARQIRERPYAAPQLCDSSPRSRHRYSHHPDAARPSASVDHGALYPGRDDDDRQNDRPFDRLNLAEATPD